MNLYDRRTVKLFDVATIERAKAGKAYPADSILIQVSATNGQLKYMDESSQVEGKFAVIQPDCKVVRPRYLFIVLEMVMPAFLARYQTTMNIQMDVFKHLKFEIHNELDTQWEIVKVFATLDKWIDDEQQTIGLFKDFKRWHLDTMFC